MKSKSERTREFILEKVSPIFNQKGYSGTSISDFTEATGLTKGCLYGNFQNKEDLAIQSLSYNVKKVIQPLSDQLSEISSPLEKLYKIAEFYKHYAYRVKNIGGCPILKVGVDSNQNHPELFQRVKSISQKLENSFKDILGSGISLGEIRKDIDPEYFAKVLYSMMEGAILMSFIHDDEIYLHYMSDQFKTIIEHQLRS